MSRSGGFAQLLHIYLDDHRAASVAGIALTRRTARANPGPLGECLRGIVDELEEDQALVDQLMVELGARRRRTKYLLARVGAELGRLKLNGRLLSYSPLSRVLELEALLGGINTRGRLWVALAEIEGDDARVGPSRTAGELAERARAQVERLDPFHRDAVRVAFGVDGRDDG
jgi:hypothetical protein